MRLFDAHLPDSLQSGGFSEPTYSRLNRSARPGLQFVRGFLEDWFERYPASHKPELRARFRSSSNYHHNSAFFELFLHQLLLSLGCSVEIHPPLTETSRSPDFHVDLGGNHPFYLEAAVATYQSAEDAAAEARLHQLYDVLNRHVDSTDFFIWVEVNRAPDAPPPARRIARFLNDHLREIDPDEVTITYETKGDEALPSWAFIHEGWSVLFRPIPKKPHARGKPGVRPLGMFSSPARLVDHRTPLRDAITDKASAYGEFDEPYVVALNALEMIDEIDVLDALFGKEQVTVRFSPDNPDQSITTSTSRVPDGVWMSPSGPTNTRLSAVVIAYRLRPWSLGEASIRLYHNPWAARTYQSALTRLPQAIPREGRYDYVDGKQAIEVLGIDWPGDLAG